MEEFEKKVVEAINTSHLSYEAVRYVLKHVLDVVDLQYQNTLLKKESEVKTDE